MTALSGHARVHGPEHAAGRGVRDRSLCASRAASRPRSTASSSAPCPIPPFPPFMEDGAAVLSGDGMVSAMRIAGGKASFAMRYVQTERHQAEVAAGRALFGKYRNPFTDRPEAAGLDRTVANTTPRVACRATADDQGRRPPVSRRSAHARDPGPLRFRRQAQVRDGDGACAHRSATPASCSSMAMKPTASPRPRSPTASPTGTATWSASSGSTRPTAR